MHWHMTGQARVASRQRPLPIHLCLPPFLPILHTLILHTSTCYALAQKPALNNPRNCHRVIRFRESITRKTLQRVPVRVPGKCLVKLFSKSISDASDDIMYNDDTVIVTISCNISLISLQTSLLIAREEASG